MAGMATACGSRGIRPSRRRKCPSSGSETVERDIETILFSEPEILSGIDRTAAAITAELGDEPFTVVSVLKGACVFCADLIRRIPTPIELAFVGASSYGARTEPSDLEISYFPLGGEIEGRRLLLVDDILDTGRTLSTLKAELLARGASEVRTCVFLDKPARRVVPIEPDFRVFSIDDVFVVGYGLDFAGRYRNLPFVGALRDSVVRGAVGGGRP